MSSEEKEPCPICGGTGRIVTSDLSAAMCDCMRRRRLKNFLGPEMAMASYLKEGSSLYKPGDGKLDTKPSIDRTTENLFIKIRWSDFLRHAQLALGGRYWRDDTFRYRIVTDERLLNVWLGNEHYKARATKKRDDADSYNSLRDLIEDYDLVIVRLGLLGYKNIAAPGVLKQALMIREVTLKPTWVIQTPTPNGDRPRSWDDEVSVYIAENYDIVDFLRTVVATPTTRPAMQVEDTTGDDESKSASSEEKVDPDLLPSNEEDPEGRTRSHKYKPGWKRRGGNSGGSGPIGGISV